MAGCDLGWAEFDAEVIEALTQVEESCEKKPEVNVKVHCFVHWFSGLILTECFSWLT